MTDEYFVEQLCRRMGEEEPFGIEWQEHPEGGLMSEINGVNLRIYGAQDSPIVLELSRGIKKHPIREPAVLNRYARNFLNMLGRDSSKDDVENKLRDNLNELLNRAVRQCLSLHKDPEARERVKQELFETVIGRI